MNTLRSMINRTIMPAVITGCLVGTTTTPNAAENVHRNHGGHAYVQVQKKGVVEQGRWNSYGTHRYHSVGASMSIPLPPIPFGRVVVSLPGTCRTYRCGTRSYYHCNGVFYSRHLGGYEVVRAPRIRFLPDHARRLVVSGEVYFVHNDQYYCYRDGFYELCVPPVVVEKNITTLGTTTVMVENSNGSRTPVDLQLLGSNQWKGPRGEIYNGLPDNDQLQDAYGF